METVEAGAQKETRRLTPERSKRWLWPVIFGVVLLLLVGLALRSILSDNSAPSPFSPPLNTPIIASSTQSTQTAQADWQTIQTFTGNSTNNAQQKTKVFSVDSNWRLTWNCKGNHGIDDWLYVSIYNRDGSLYNAGAQITCVDGKQVTGNADEPQSGTFYLSVNASTDWTVTIEVPQK